MDLKPFELERWLNKPRDIDLASASITKLKIGDLVSYVDPEMLLSYGLTKGSESIREKVSSLYNNIDPERILITSGTAEANFLALLRLLEPGSEVVVIGPTYMQCVNFARGMGAKIRFCILREEEEYRFNPTELKRQVSKQTDLIFCVNPNNPTGSILSENDMKTICEIAESIDAWVLGDGALRGLEVEGVFASSPVSYYEKGIATGSLSKIGLSGIRIGWMVARKEFVDTCWSYKDYTTLCHSGIGEYFAEIALQQDNFSRYLKRSKDIVVNHSKILAEWINQNRKWISWVPSRAGHTAFLKYRLDLSTRDFCSRLLEEEGVLVSPGDFFETPNHLRLRYSGPEGELHEGLRRLGAFIERRVSEKGTVAKPQ